MEAEIKKHLEALRQLMQTGALAWKRIDAPQGLEAYEGQATGYFVNVVRGNTERGPTYEGLLVAGGGVIVRLPREDAKALWDAAFAAAGQVKPSTPQHLVEIDGYTVLVGDNTPRMPPPLMIEPPVWLKEWADHDVEARQGVVFFQNMLEALKMPVVEGSQRTLPLWHVPATGSVYAIDRERKTFVLIKGKPDEWHWKNYAVMAKLGYTVSIQPIQMEIGWGKSTITISE